MNFGAVFSQCCMTYAFGKEKALQQLIGVNKHLRDLTFRFRFLPGENFRLRDLKLSLVFPFLHGD